MPAKNYLTLEKQENLQKALKREENGDIRERILILLLMNDGKTQSEIANFIGCSKVRIQVKEEGIKEGATSNPKVAFNA